MKPSGKDAVSIIIKTSSTRPALHVQIGFILEAINFYVMLQNVYLNFSSLYSVCRTAEQSYCCFVVVLLSRLFRLRIFGGENFL